MLKTNPNWIYKLIATIKNQNSYSVQELAKVLYFVKITSETFEETKKLFIA
ncbi:hypothetical protein FLJU110815_03730 [Flavobacterium jumunjinense]